MPHVENDRIVESTTEARAGVTGQTVKNIVLIGTGLDHCSRSGGYSAMILSYDANLGRMEFSERTTVRASLVCGTRSRLRPGHEDGR
jgi:hypothetical protein